MSGPHLIQYSIRERGLTVLTRWMKCWSEGEGVRALNKKKRLKVNQTIVVRAFKAALPRLESNNARRRRISAVRHEKANGEQTMPETAFDDAGTFLPADLNIQIGDAITCRHVVTHTNIAGGVCGVKIGDNIIGFTEKDILTIERRALKRGDVALLDNHLKVRILHVEAEFSMVTTSDPHLRGSSLKPFIADTSKLVRAA